MADVDCTTRRAASTQRPLAPHGWWMAFAGVVLAAGAAAGPHVLDAGELVTAVWTLGASHPPGQPLHPLLAYPLSLMPLGSIPWRISLFSVVCGCIAAWLAGRLTGLVLERSELPRSLPVRLAPDAVATGVLLVPAVLRQLPRPEVYAAALALTLYAIVQIVRWAVAGSGGGRWLRRAALAVGLLTGLHLPHALVVVAVAAACVGVLRPRVWQPPRALAWVAALGVLGLAVHLYLPVRAHAGAPMWGRPDSLAGFVEYVSASAYHHNLGSGQRGLAANIVAVLAHLVWSSGVLPLLGLAALLVRARGAPERLDRLAYALATAVALATGPALLQPLDPRVPDQVAYLAPACVVLLAAAGAGWALLAHGARRPGTIASAAGLLLVALHPVGLLTAPRNAQADAPALETLQGALMDTPPPRALVVAETDAVAGSWMMARAIDGARPDVALLVTGLSTSSWHWRALAPHPVFDGRALRTGEPARGNRFAPFVRAAVRHARDAVATVSEPDWPLGGRGAVAGPYLVRPPGRATDVRARHPRSAGERFAAALDRDARGTPDDIAAGVVRHHQLQRIRRLAARDLLPAAGRSAAAMLWWLPEQQRAPLERLERAGGARPWPPVVRDPKALKPSPEDAVRTAAVLLWSAGEPVSAVRLLEAQVDRGDACSLLQLAWLHLDAGRIQQARRARDAFVQLAPDLASEATALSRRLGGPP